MMKMSVMMQKVVYGALFCVLLPVILWQWAAHMDDALMMLAVPDVPWIGSLAAMAGLGLMLWAMWGLWHRGKGLPMNAFPPQEYVFTGAYRVCRHPIYVGAVLLCFGLAWLNGSAAGVGIVTPLFVLLILAYVWGFEREVIEQAFQAKPLLHKTWCDLPPNNGQLASWANKLRMALLVFVPWLLGYECFVWAGVPSDVWYSNNWGLSVPFWSFTVVFYVLAYPLIVAVPFLIHSNRSLRVWAVEAWLGMLLIFYGYLVIPAAVHYQALPQGVFNDWIEWGRDWDSPMAALPSFHVFWVLLAMRYFVEVAQPYRRYLSILGYLVIISCLSTGNHTLPDVLAAYAVYGVVCYRRMIYVRLLKMCENIANSWQEWRFGKIRVINHGFYAALGGFLGFLIMGYLLPDDLWAVYLMGVAGFIGAGLWAQWVEGSAALLRPFGYYGSVIGIVLAVCLVGLLGADIWALLAAAALAACPIQLFGRCRCLVQGCCHGKPTDTVLGLRFTHEKSRVNKLAGWRGVNVHPTQFYSMAANFFSFFILWRCYTLGMPASFIVGLYFILSGAFRFVEESLRGEPQTPYFMGMRVYQWLALASVLLGMVLMSLPSDALVKGEWHMSMLLQAVLYFGLIWLVYGVDFPDSNKRFSRLTQE